MLTKIMNFIYTVIFISKLNYNGPGTWNNKFGFKSKEKCVGSNLAVPVAVTLITHVGAVARRARELVRRALVVG